MSSRCYHLSGAGATDPAVAGAKAAGLARAYAVGLPVLPGVIVPVSESRGVVDAVTSTLGHGSDGTARLAAMDVHPDDALLAELREQLSGIDPPYIVRSSSPLEADGTWSGAFSSFHGIAPDELGIAVRGCWGSAFAPAVLDRARRTGTDPGRLGLAVLVQPELNPDLGGTARLTADGSVRITATDGPLRPLMAGHVDGWQATVAGDGTMITGTLDDGPLLRQVAELARDVGAALGHNLIEWAVAAGEVTLLQSMRSRDAVVAGSSRAACHGGALGGPIALRVARLAERYAGELGDELVLPWAIAASWMPELPDEGSGAEPSEALAAARALAAQLTARVWGGSPRAAASRAGDVLRQLRGDDPAAALETVAELPGPAPDEAAGVLAHLATVRRAMGVDGSADAETAFWRLAPGVLARALAGEPPPRTSRFGVERWEPFVHGVVSAVGERYAGTAAVPGAGAGRACQWEDMRERGLLPGGRYVLLAPEPEPALGPLLWNAAGLVTRAGSTGAHLIEFARSIGVPTVVGCDLPRLSGDERPLLAVDGERGTVSVAGDGHLGAPASAAAAIFTT
ncbi:hypothetical protein EF847_05785 [Actinobacteria bacterium YIM 96077]|uniref:PEP-utilising enzyme mobile domain-containing protein n=1 Tax=Phytoactinopolyspora halophila TaxID=1981511 RepID=A0A329QR08_9ACTN|nr:PEP-utilizing enzyme [Phytoactinopolyspora halophila]AYY12290.1 hypothetical protein EF847_05785 [Actinobacteria bacterium YIM 96077]RAW13792.1 hypothetical protein DPM12_12370 [Phytoactinopolyspora halophila]